MQELTFGEVTLQFEMQDGTLNIYRDDQPEGAILIIEPDPPEPQQAPAAEPPSIEPEVLPPGFYFDGDVLMQDGTEVDGQWSGGRPVHSNIRPKTQES